jgi:hypothetical protein
MIPTDVFDALGLPFDLLEEIWTSDEGPAEQEIRVFQRCLILLGYPTGGHGRPCIDGVVGPNMRRALKQYQDERGLPADARLDAELRRRLYDEAAAWLAAFDEPSRTRTHGQLLQVEDLPPYTAHLVIHEFLHEADERVAEPLRPAFYALVSWANNAITLPCLPLKKYLENLRTMSPREARLAALRYGYLRQPLSYFEKRFGAAAARALNPGDLAFHFDVVAAVLQDDAELRQAAEAKNGEAMLRRLEWLEDDSSIRGPATLPNALAEFAALLARQPVTPA